MPTRQSVQCVLVMACALGVAEAEGTSQERSQTVKRERAEKQAIVHQVNVQRRRSLADERLDGLVCLQSHPPRTACVALSLQGSIPLLMTLRAPEHARFIMHT